MYLAPLLHDLTRRVGTSARVSVGIDQQGSSLEGVQDVWRVLDGHGEFWIVHEGPGGSGIFHPKVFLFEGAAAAELVVGSANLTGGGLYRNHELSVALRFDDLDDDVLVEVRQALDAWQTAGPNCLAVTPALITDLHQRGDLPSEAAQRVARGASRAAARAAGGTIAPPQNPFAPSQRMVAPAPRAMPVGIPAPPVTAAPPPTLATPVAPVTTPAVPATPRMLIMEVVPHHNGEVFLSKRAINDDPVFFGHPFTGWSVPKQAHNAPYPQLDPQPVVEILIYDQHGNIAHRRGNHALYVVEYTRKSEIRITIPDGLTRHIPDMSVMVMTKDPIPQLDYRLEFFPPGVAPTALTAQMNVALPSGGKPVRRHYGWA